MAVAVAVLAIAVGLLGVLVFGLLRTHAEILRALYRSGISLDADAASPVLTSAGQRRAEVPRRSGTPPGDIVGTVPGGGPAKVSVTGGDGLTLLAFLSSGCRGCKELWKAFASPDLELPVAGARLVIVGQDPLHDSESALAALVAPGVKAVLSSAAWQAYDVPGSPYFALVDGGGKVIGAGTANTWEQMQGLLHQALADESMVAGARRGRGSASGRRRKQRADEALLSAGVGPDHPSLFPGNAAATAIQDQTARS